MAEIVLLAAAHTGVSLLRLQYDLFASKNARVFPLPKHYCEIGLCSPGCFVVPFSAHPYHGFALLKRSPNYNRFKGAIATGNYQKLSAIMRLLNGLADKGQSSSSFWHGVGDINPEPYHETVLAFWF